MTFHDNAIYNALTRISRLTSIANQHRRAYQQTERELQEAKLEAFNTLKTLPHETLTALSENPIEDMEHLIVINDGDVVEDTFNDNTITVTRCPSVTPIYRFKAQEVNDG